MSTRNNGLTADVLFVGATRPPMRWGVTYAALLANLVCTLEAFLLTRNLLTLLVCLPVHGLCALLCARDPRYFDLILRCAGSEHGGTSQFAARLIGEREVIRRQIARGRDREGLFAARSARRSTNVSEQHVLESAVLAAQLEQLPDLTGYLKTAASPRWLRVSFRAGG